MVIADQRYEDRPLPFDHAAEAAVLGGLLIDGDALLRLSPLVEPQDFHRARHQYIYEAALSIWGRQEAIDQITLARELAQRNRLDAVGGLPYLGELVANTPTSVNVEYYASIVADTAAKRRLIDAGNRIAGLAFDDREPAAEVARQATDVLFQAMPAEGGHRGFRHISGAYDAYLQGDDSPLADTSGRPIPTGLHNLDDIGTGFRPSDLVILGARPAVGKSSLSLNVCLYAAQQGYVCGIYSLEMSIEQIAARILSAETGISSHRLASGLYTEAEENLIADQVGYLSGLPIYVDDTPAQNMAQMHSKAQRLQMRHGLDFLVVDYLQLIQPPAGYRPGNTNLAQQVSEISRGLKTLARDLHIPVLCCSQLSRAPETRANHRPLLSDLRESGSIEQDADIVLFLYRVDQYQTEDEWSRLYPGQPYPRNVTEVIVAKHRHGPIGSASLYFRDTTMRFYQEQTTPPLTI